MSHKIPCFCLAVFGIWELLKLMNFYVNVTLFVCWFVCWFVTACVSWLLIKGSKCEASFAPVVQNQKTIHRTRTFLVWLDACYNMNTNPLSFSALGCPGAIKIHQVFPLWVVLTGESFIWLPCASLLLLRHVPRSVFWLQSNHSF